jgi:dipeptidyl aminopeptidase/acylaminoacyl peptidase
VIEPEPEAERDRRTPRLVKRPEIVGPPPVYETPSPDGAWFLGSRNGNLYLRSRSDGHFEALTTDGTEDYGWDYNYATIPVWAPDSRAFAARKTDLRGRQFTRTPVMHWLKSPLDVEWVAVGTSGTIPESFIIDIASRRQIPLKVPGQLHVRAWRPDGSELLVSKEDPKKIELLAFNRGDGGARQLLSEQAKTFLDVSITMPNSPSLVPLAGSRGFLWLSERDGWNQIYFYAYDGSLIRQLTTDRRPVERVVTVDDRSGWVYYTAHGGEGRPYDLALYRVSLNGGVATRLTQASGQHDVPVYEAYLGTRGAGIQFSPSFKFFLDTNSDVTRLPETDLRRADGSLLETLSRADESGLRSVAPNPPEEFTAKAADGVTDLYGVLYKPWNFSPSQKYPVVDFIYAGPQTIRVPRLFAHDAREQAFANLGLILFVVDARGTPGRGKAFQDVAFDAIGRNEIPDHVAVLKQLAAVRPYIDLGRAGIMGGSFGGYYAMRGMLQAPDVFHVGVAMAPDDADASLRLWMGSREENPAGYEFASNLPLARNLKGRLLIIHGTSDVNAPFAGTMRMIDALERADKTFDLIVVPEGDHSVQSSRYTLESAKRYFVEHLGL